MVERIWTEDTSWPMQRQPQSLAQRAVLYWQGGPVKVGAKIVAMLLVGPDRLIVECQMMALPLAETWIAQRCDLKDAFLQVRLSSVVSFDPNL